MLSEYFFSIEAIILLVYQKFKKSQKAEMFFEVSPNEMSM